jgi:hypothetical protein
MNIIEKNNAEIRKTHRPH